MISLENQRINKISRNIPRFSLSSLSVPGYAFHLSGRAVRVDSPPATRGG